MIRAVVYRDRADRGPDDADESPVYGRTEPSPQVPEVAPSPDGYLSRIIKYIPGETLALVLPASLIPGLDDWHLWLIAIAGLIGTPLWLRFTARRQLPPHQQPHLRFYAIALLAYCPWIFASSTPVRDVIGIDQELTAVLLFLAAYFLPLLDDQLDDATRPVPSQ